MDQNNAARLAGYVDAPLTAIGQGRIPWVLESQERNRTLNDLGQALGLYELAQLMASGAAMSEDRAVEFARSI